MLYINGKLAIDLGGVHGSEGASITLDAATAAALGLVHRKPYFFDFFLAERHVTGSNCVITTSLQLETQKVGEPVLPPGGIFDTKQTITFTDTTTDVTFYYTTDGSIPTDSTGIKYTGPIDIFNTTTINVIAYKEDWNPSNVITVTYTKNPIPSFIKIVKSATDTTEVPYLTEGDGSLFTRLTTTQINLTTATLSDSTKLALDKETTTLNSPVSTAKNIVFSGSSTFAVSTATKNNGKTEASPYDTLIVSWVNPSLATDKAEKRILIRPAPRQSSIYFSTKPDGSDSTKNYPLTTKAIYVVIKDQLPNPSKVYSVVISSETRGIDSETVTFIPNPSGTTVVKLDIKNDTKISGDKILQISLGGDQLRAIYFDPVDGEKAEATSGFDANVQEVASLIFTDAAGVQVLDSTVWSPNAGKIFISYSDDYAAGSITTKIATLTLVNKKYGVVIGTDKEPITLTLVPPAPGSTRATWTGSINLVDAFPSADSNGVAQTHFRGEATISINTHDNLGVQQPTTASDLLLIAYPDQIASLSWRLADPEPKNPEGLIVSIKDQSFTSSADTAFVSVGCSGSGDSVSNFGAIEGLPINGVYTTGQLIKNDIVPNFADQLLSCLTTDQIHFRYVDPVYGTVTEIIVNEVAKPIATLPTKKFITSEDVTLSTSTPGAKIYYTIDGKIPVPGTSALYTSPIHINLTTTVKAIAVLAGYKDSKVLTEIYTKEKVASRLQILDENGNQIAGKALTGASTGIRIKLITTQDAMGSIIADVKTLVNQDAESIPLGNPTVLGNAFEFSQNAVLASPSNKTTGNFIIDAKGTDTLIVTWTNPFDATDFAKDTVTIKPAFIAAEVYFSTSEGGPRISTYAVNQDSLFIVVKSRPMDPTLNYTVAVSSIQNGADNETLTLKEISPGIFSAKAPIGKGAKTSGDKILEVAAAGDQLTAIFVDPVYKDSYTGNVGFAQSVEEVATLIFIDDKGNPIAPTDIWSPEKGKVYLRYTDDWSAGIDSKVHTKTITLNLSNKKNGLEISSDIETLTLTLVGTPTGTKGTWEGSLTLTDSNSTKNNDAILETYFRGELTASVNPHNNSGTEVGSAEQDQLVIAYPNQPAEIIIADDSGKTVTRPTSKVKVTIADQQFSKSGNPSIQANVSCGSGDIVSNVNLIWDGTHYVIQPLIDKGETAGASVNKSDALLQCLASDILTVTYKDPVFPDLPPRTAFVSWTEDTKSKLYYAGVKDSLPLNSVTDVVDKGFLIVVEGISPTRDKVDTILVTLTTAQGEKETYKAIETGIITGKFIVKANFTFTSGTPKQENQKVEGKIVLTDRINQVLVNGEATIAGVAVKADISMRSFYNLIAKAYIKDENENGRADHVYLVFDHKLSSLPSSLDSVYWNMVNKDYAQTAAPEMLSYLKGSDSSIVVADFSKSEFKSNLTNIPEGERPYATLPDDNIFGGQQAQIIDSVGPVISKAEKKPSNLQSYSFTGTEKRFNPDTLVISVSEKIKTTVSSFGEMLRFSKGCADYNQSDSIKTLAAPTVTSDGLTWTIIVDNSPDAKSPLVGDCIFLEAGGHYLDLVNNRPAHLGMPLVGENPKLVIRDFRGYPPVAGLDPESPAFILASNDSRIEQAGTFTTQSGNGKWTVPWIAPFGYEGNNPVGSLQNVNNQINENSSTDAPAERLSPTPLPTNISTVRVITSGAYLAKIHIYDNLGHFVRYMEQSYGFHGEDKNPWRATDKGQMSFLVWDLFDKDGQKAGNGVYVWKVNFSFIGKNVKSEVRLTRTGVMRLP